jgi:hypothetical protein
MRRASRVGVERAIAVSVRTEDVLVLGPRHEDELPLSDVANLERDVQLVRPLVVALTALIADVGVVQPRRDATADDEHPAGRLRTERQATADAYGAERIAHRRDVRLALAREVIECREDVRAAGRLVAGGDRADRPPGRRLAAPHEPALTVADDGATAIEASAQQHERDPAPHAVRLARRHASSARDHAMFTSLRVRCRGCGR